jgi:hypothetical protein
VFGVGHSGFISSLSCLRASFCFGLDGAGNVLVSSDPAAGPQAWITTRVDARNTASAISCASPSLCVVTESNGYVATSTNPTAGAGAWTASYADTGLGFECGKYGPGSNCDPGLQSVSCPSTSFCAASDFAGNVIASSNPTGGGSAWKLTAVENGPADGYITCPSAGLCAEFVRYSSSVAVSGNPAAGSWHLTEVPGGLFGGTCPSAKLCVGPGPEGLVTSTNPTGGPSAWKATNIDDHQSLSVSCAPGGQCIAFDAAGNVLTSARPAGGRPAWTLTHLDEDPVTGAACPSPTLCVAADQYGRLAVGKLASAR